VGGVSRQSGERGFILLDVLVTLFILMIGFAVFLGSVHLAGSIAVGLNDRVVGLLEQRSTDAKERVILFQQTQ
jgi:hypothetical protein